MSQADFGIIGDLFAVIKSAAEHGTKFPQIVAAAHSKLAEIEAGLARQADFAKKQAADAASTPVAPSARPYVPGESEALADADTASDQQPSLLDRRI